MDYKLSKLKMLIIKVLNANQSFLCLVKFYVNDVLWEQLKLGHKNACGIDQRCNSI